MKTIALSLIAIALLTLGACAADGSPDPDFNQALGDSLDAATKILEVVIQGVQTFGGQ